MGLSRLQTCLALCCVLALAAVAPVALAGDAGQEAATVEFDQTTTGNVFLADETPTVDVESDADTVVWTAERYDGERVANGTLAVDGEATLDLPVDRAGYYELRAWEAGSRGDTAMTTVGVLPADGFDNDDRFYGFSTHFGQGWDHELMPLLETAGAATARDEHAWMRVEESQGSYDFSGPAQAGFMEALRDRGVDRLFILAYGNPIYGGEWNHLPHTESYRQAFANYSVAALDRYDDLEYVEIWNEPNLDTYVSGPVADDPAAYAALLETTYGAVKAEHPDVTVLGGSTAGVSDHGNNIDYEYMEGMLAAGAADSMDAISVHPYRPRPTGYAADFDRLRNLTAEYNDGEALPIWVTEFGWPSGPQEVTEATQARYLVRGHVGLRAAGAQRVYWYTFRDDQPPGEAGDGYPFGLIRHPDDPVGPHTAKPTLAAYSTMTRQIAGAESVSKRSDAPVTAYDYGPAAGTEAGDAGPRTVLWVPSSTDATDVTLAVDDPVTVTTMTGERERLSPVDGAVYLTVDTDPIYVQGDVESISRGAPVGIDGSTEEVTFSVDGDGGLGTVTHSIAGRQETLSAGGGETADRTVPVPDVYRPMRPEGGDAFYLGGGHRVDDVVGVDGEPVGLLSTRVQPDPIHPAAAGGDAGTATPTAGPTATATSTDASAPSTATPSTDDTGATTDASGPGFGPVLALIAGLLTVVLATLTARRR